MAADTNGDRFSGDSRDNNHSGHDEELLAAYVLGALPADEGVEVRAWLATCGTCSTAARQWEATTDRLAAAYSAAPPGALKERTLRAVRALPATAGSRSLAALPDLPVPSQTRRRSQRPAASAGASRRGWAAPALVGLAASLLLVSLGLGALTVWQQQELDSVVAAAERVERVLADPQLRTLRAPVAGGGEGRAFVSDEGAVVLAAGLPELAADRTYQLWIGSGQSVRSAGLLSADGAVARSGVVEGIGAEDALMLSVEPAGGSAQPTTTPVWRVEV